MRILFCGDIVGKPGRDAVIKYVPILRKKLALDFVVVNVENAASGWGVTRKICDDILTCGVDVMSSGDHIFDQKETMFFIDEYSRLLRPANLPSRLPGKGFDSYTTNSGKRTMVINLHAQLFMKLQVDSPFECADKILEKNKLGRDADVIIVDFHCEATSERMGLGHYLDGRVSMVVGSHTHVPTADEHILPKGTAYQTDAGMCGDYDSVIGFDKQISITAFLNKVKSGKMLPATGDGTISGLFVVTDDNTGLAKYVSQVRMGGRLAEVIPVYKDQ